MAAPRIYKRVYEKNLHITDLAFTFETGEFKVDVRRGNDTARVSGKMGLGERKSDFVRALGHPECRVIVVIEVPDDSE